MNSMAVGVAVPERPSILVLAAGSLGDSLITLPALRCLQSRGNVTLAGTYPYLALGPKLMGVSAMTRFEMVYERVLTGEYSEELEAFQEIYVLLKDPDLAIETRLKRIRPKVFFPSRPFKNHEQEQLPAADYWTGFLREYGLDPSPEDPLLIPDDSGLKQGEKILQSLGMEKPLLIHPGSGGSPKVAPFSFFLRQALHGVRRGKPGLVLWGEAEVPRLTEIRAFFSDALGIKVQPQSWNLKQLAGLMFQSGGYFGNDSGISHLAAACGLPVIAVFGPTNSRVWRPRGARVVEGGPDFDRLPEEIDWSGFF